jgi:hypothetical protein
MVVLAACEELLDVRPGKVGSINIPLPIVRF